MLKEIIVATKNEGKALEFKEIFQERGYSIKTLLDYPHIPDVKEDGKTFAENAKIKAETIAKELKRLVVADDSGLMVSALDGDPGVYSARYAGPDKDDQKNNEKLLNELEKLGPDTDRSATFHSTIAMSAPGLESLTVFGQVKGQILDRPRGDEGFGYDPLFYVPSLGKTLAELSLEEKNKISHRAQAIKELDKVFDQWINQLEG